MTAPKVIQKHPVRVVLYEGAPAVQLGGSTRAELMTRLLEAGYTVTRTAASGGVSPTDQSPLFVIGDFGGQAPRFEDAAGETAVHVHDLAEQDVERALEHLRGLSAQQEGAAPGEWMPWFPVIDFDRCTNCMQCLSFCLFDVYGVDEGGQITVRNESNCKTMCPACSRVCPEVAILFPKYKKGPINGDVVRQEDVTSESMKVDISALLGGDIYSSLRERSETAKKRFSTERDESKALLERKRCLKELKESLDIPDEVLMTLPSAGDIEERARRAKEKMEKRMARSQTVADQRPAPTEEEWGI